MQRQRKAVVGGLQLAADAGSLQDAEEQENVDPAKNKETPFMKPVPKLAPPPRAVPLAPLVVVQPARPRANWTLKTGATFASPAPLTAAAKGLIGSGKLDDCLSYYCFPYPRVSQLQQRRISQLLLSSERNRRGKDAELLRADVEYFEALLGSWRKAFLSLYEGLKARPGAHFYYFQHDLAALFRHRREGEGLEVVLCQFGEGLRVALDREAIRYEASGPIDIEELQQDAITTTVDVDEGSGTESHDDEPEEEEEEEEEDDLEKVEQIRAEISARIKRRKLQKIHKRTQNHGLLRIIDVHDFADYLLNQRNGRAFVILPELVSPEPFLLGTQCRCEVVVHGEDAHGVARVKVGGLVMPEALGKMQSRLEGVAEVPLGLATETDPRTLTLSQLPFNM